MDNYIIPLDKYGHPTTLRAFLGYFRSARMSSDGDGCVWSWVFGMRLQHRYDHSHCDEGFGRTRWRRIDDYE